MTDSGHGPQRIRHDAPTELAPTMSAGVVEPSLAWELCEEPEPDSGFGRGRWVTALVLAGCLVAVGVAGAVGLAFLPRGMEAGVPQAAVIVTVTPEPDPQPGLESPPSPEPHAPTAATTAPAAATPDVPRLQDGTYRVVYDWPNAKRRAEDAYFWSTMTDRPPTSALMDLSTTCTPECVTVVTPLTEQRTPHPDSGTSEMRFDDGAWRENTANQPINFSCIYPNGATGVEQVSSMAHVYPGAPPYRGNVTYFVVESECGNAMRSLATPITLTRVEG